MIALIIALSGLAVLSLPGLFPLGSAPGKDRARVLVGSTLVGLAAFEVGLVLLALPTVLRGLVVIDVVTIGTCPLLPPDFGGPIVGISAGLVAVVVATRCAYVVLRVRQRNRSIRAEPWFGSHEPQGDFELVILPSEAVLAVSVPGRPPQVLVSQGLLDRLSPGEVAAVLRHEAAHVRARHWRFTLAALLVEQVFSPMPLAHLSGRALRDALELWADEAAMDDAPDDRASLHDALLTVACESDGPQDAVEATSRSRSVLERLRRLDKPAARPSLAWRILVHSPAFLVAIAVLATSATSIIGAEHTLVLAR